MRILQPENVKSGQFLTLIGPRPKLFKNQRRLFKIRSVGLTVGTSPGVLEYHATVEDIMTTHESRFVHIKELLQHPHHEVYTTKEEILNLYPEDFI